MRFIKIDENFSKVNESVKIELREKGIILNLITDGYYNESPLPALRLIERRGISYDTLKERFPNKSLKETLCVVYDRFVNDDRVTDAPLKTEMSHTLYMHYRFVAIDVMNTIRHYIDSPYQIKVEIDDKNYSRYFLDLMDEEDSLELIGKAVFGEYEKSDSNVIINGKPHILFDDRGLNLYSSLGLYDDEDKVMGKPIAKNSYLDKSLTERSL